MSSFLAVMGLTLFTGVLEHGASTGGSPHLSNSQSPHQGCVVSRWELPIVTPHLSYGITPQLY